MSNEALTWAFRQDLPLTQKFVLVALADYADERGECFPNHERTAQRTGTSVSTVKRAIRALADADYLSTSHQYRDDGRFRANRYHLNVGHEVPGQSDPVGGPQRPDYQARVTPLPGQSDPGTGSEWASNNPQENPHRNPQGNRGAAAADARPEPAQLEGQTEAFEIAPAAEPDPWAAVAKNVYDATDGALPFMGMQTIAKWAITHKGVTSQAVEAAIGALWRAGRAVTKQTVAQHLEGHLQPHSPGLSRRQQEIADYERRKGLTAPAPRGEISR